MMAHQPNDARLIQLILKIDAELPRVVDVDALAYAVTMAADVLPRLLEERDTWAELAQSESDRCEWITRKAVEGLLLSHRLIQILEDAERLREERMRVQGERELAYAVLRSLVRLNDSRSRDGADGEARWLIEVAGVMDRAAKLLGAENRHATPQGRKV